MTVTAKPTYTIWDDRTRQRNFLFKRNGLRDVEISAELMEDTVSVISETGLTPRQLLKQRDVLQEHVRELEALLEVALSNAEEVVANMQEQEQRTGGIGFDTRSEEEWIEETKAALAKHGEGV